MKKDVANEDLGSGNWDLVRKNNLNGAQAHPTERAVAKGKMKRGIENWE
jgi:hypothetical protein